MVGAIKIKFLTLNENKNRERVATESAFSWIRQTDRLNSQKTLKACC